MYKKIELLSKSNHKNLTLDSLDNLDFSKDLKLVTLGLSEIAKLSGILPIIISGGDEQQFVVFSALSNKENYFSAKKCQDIYIPMSIKSYPFTMVNSFEEGNEKRKFRAVGVDVKSDFIGKSKKYKLFIEDGKLGEFASSKVAIAQNLDKDKANSQKLINSLKEYNLLDKRSFEIKIQDGTTKSLLSDFYVVNKERLFQLDENIIVKWAKNGWLYAIESHIHSISQINTLLQQLIKKDSK